MGDVGDYWKEHREYRRSQGLPARKAKPLAVAARFGKAEEKAGWRQCSEWHWQRWVDNSLLDYWPSKDKWRWRGETFRGNRAQVDAFIKAKETTR